MALIAHFVFAFGILNEDKCTGSVGTRFFNGPRMTLGSYVKGPNNMICREVGLKGRTLVTGQRFSRDFYGSFYMGGLGLTS